jgi:hypothetical protein
MEKEERLRSFVEKLFPGRWAMLRPMSAKELKATTVLGLELREASAKIRTGPPGDEEVDCALPIWAGVLPVSMTVHAPVDDPRLMAGLLPPAHATGFRLG